MFEIDLLDNANNCPFRNTCKKVNSDKCNSACKDYSNMITHAKTSNISPFRFTPSNNKLLDYEFSVETSKEQLDLIKNDLLAFLEECPIVIIDSKHLEARIKVLYQLMIIYMTKTRNEFAEGFKRRFWVSEWETVKYDISYQEKQELMRVEFLAVEYAEMDNQLYSILFHRRERRKPTLITHIVDSKASEDVKGLITQEKAYIIV